MSIKTIKSLKKALREQEITVGTSRRPQARTCQCGWMLSMTTPPHEDPCGTWDQQNTPLQEHNKSPNNSNLHCGADSG
jgi:hypothetical protein